MATKLTLTEVKVQFPGAWESEIAGLDPEDIMDILGDMAAGESEYWVHNGTLYGRSWWTALGWHYGEWDGTSWFCPDAGEEVCPWGE